MKKQLLKSMLVGVMTLAATGAWAETFYSQDYEGGASADWSSSVSGRFTPTILDDESNHYLSVDQSTRNNNGCILTSTSLQGKVAEEKDFTMLFDVKIGSSTNQTPVEFNIYDAANSAKILALVATGTYATTYTVNNNSEQKPAISAGGGKALNELAWMSFKLSRSGSLTYLTIINKATEEVVFERAIINTLSEKGGLGKMEFITKRYNANFAIDNIVVRDIEDGDVPVATPTTYTVKFQDEGGNVIKDDLVVNTVVGTEVTASASMVASFYANDKKYIYVSGNGAITAVEEESANVITLVFREAAIWNYTVNATGEESTVIKVLASGSAFEGDAVTVSYPLYINVNGILWTKAATNKEFRTSITLDSENMEANLAYNATEISNVIYLSEGEDIAGTTAFTGSNADIRSSNAAAGWTSENIDFVTLPVGKYKVYGVIIANSGTPVISFALGAREVLSISANNSNWTTGEAEFVVANESALSFVGGNAKSGLDFVYIQSLGTPTQEELAAAAQADLAAALAAAKAQLQEAITQATALNAYANDADLATAIDNATAALADDAATLETLGAAGMALNQKATAAAKTTLQTAVEMAKTFGVTTESVTAAEALLANSDATTEQLGAALQAICNDAVPAAKTAISEAKSFFNTFDKDAAADLEDEFAALEATLEGTDINAIKSAIQALYAQATPAAKTAIEKVKGYLEVMNNETIIQDLAALQAAMDSNDFPAIIAAAKKAKEDLTTAVPAFLTEVNALIEAGTADGKNGVDALETAYNDANTAIMAYMAAGDNGSIVPVGEAIYNLVKAVEAYEIANRPDPTGYIVNAEFSPEADPIGWTPVRSEQFNDLGMGLIGTYQVRGEHPASTVDETHLDTEFAAGLECRWATNFAAYTQTTVEIPAGAYKLTFDVENTNANTTKANYENRFTVTVGETVYTDESTEWMQGKSAWTTHTIPFALTEASPITIGLGYGTGSNNYGVNNTPALFVSHLKLEAISALDLALAELQKAIEAAEALVPTYPVGEGLFYYAASEIEPLNQAIADAKAAYTAAESETAVKNATETLNAFVSTFAPAMTVPAENKLYAIANATATGNLCISTEKVTVKTGASVFFTAVEGGYALSNEAGEYIFKTTGNNWTLSTTTDIASAYVLTFVPVEGGYTIKGAKGLLGLDSTDEGSTVYADKTQASNGLWTIEEVSEDEALTKARQALTDEIAAAEALKTADRTKGLDEFNAAIADAQSATTATTVEELTAALQTLKTAEQTFLTANAPLAEGVYYVYNAYSKKFLSRGAGWGTQAVGDDYGLPINVTADKDSYKLQMVDNGAYYGDDFWMYADCSGDRVRSYTLEATEGGFYLHNTSRDVADNRLYIYLNDDENKWNIAGNAILNDNISDEAQAVWQFLTQAERDEIVDTRETAEKAAAFMGAGIDIDAKLKVGEETELTFATGSAWTFAAVRDGSTATTNDNGTEIFEGTGTFTQAVEGLESGLYEVSIQAFYRDGENAAVAANYDLGYNLSTSYLNVNGTNIAVKSWGADRTSVDSPNGMDTAAALFADGKYLSEGYAYVADDGKLNLTVYVPSFIGSGWFIAGNVKYAKVIVDDATGINELQANGQKGMEGAYNLSGQKVMKAGKGLYIINGKKVVK